MNSKDIQEAIMSAVKAQDTALRSGDNLHFEQLKWYIKTLEKELPHAIRRERELACGFDRKKFYEACGLWQP